MNEWTIFLIFQCNVFGRRREKWKCDVIKTNHVLQKMWKYVDSLDTRFTDILETDRLRIHYSPNRWILVLNRKERKAYSLLLLILREPFFLWCAFSLLFIRIWNAQKTKIIIAYKRSLCLCDVKQQKISESKKGFFLLNWYKNSSRNKNKNG